MLSTDSTCSGNETTNTIRHVLCRMIVHETKGCAIGKAVDDKAEINNLTDADSDYHCSLLLTLKDYLSEMSSERIKQVIQAFASV